MRKLLLIHPAMRPGQENYGKTPPLGLAYVAACTPENWQVKIADEHMEPIDFDQQVDLVGITTFTRNANRAYEISTIFRKRGIPVVLGGIHASMVPEEAQGFADAVVVGEGETAWPRLIADFERGCMKRRYVGERHPLENLPLPRRDLLPGRYEMDVVQTTRGCPFGCEFCCIAAFNGKEYRQRPAKDVLDEIAVTRKKFIYFVDDNLLGFGKKGRQRAKDLFQGMIDRKLNKLWITQISVNFGQDKELLDLAYQSGCRGVFVGIESVQLDNLKQMNKNLNFKVGLGGIQNAIRQIQRHGIFVAGGFIFGNDQDSPSVFQKTLDFIHRSGLDAYEFQLLTPYPGTALFRRLQQEGRMVYTNYPADWSCCEDNIMFRPKNLNMVDLVRGFDYVIRKLYTRRAVLWQGIKTLFRTRRLSSAYIAYTWNCETMRQCLQEWERFNHCADNPNPRTDSTSDDGSGSTPIITIDKADALHNEKRLRLVHAN